MVNIVTLILSITTIITGIIWCLVKFKQKHGSLAQHSYQKSNWLTAVKDSWLVTCASVFPVLLLVFVVRSFVFEPFKIPSGSMMPTLLIGDFILVNKFAYGIKDPIAQTMLIETSHPKRGDVVVFKYPLDPSVDYIKRVMGLPGDRIIYDPVNKSVTVYPSCASGPNCTMKVPITYSEFTPSNFVQTLFLTDKGKTIRVFQQAIIDHKVNFGIRLDQRQESFDGKIHTVLTVPGQQDQLSIYCQQQYGRSLAEWIVPQGEYFMMGDNRDNSYDSRYWGFVPEKNIVGKATAIWMSFDKHEGKWTTGLRLKRIGSSID